MKTITIPVDIPSDIMSALNESEQELKSYIKISIAISLFHEGKLTLGKAIQLAGTTRLEFENALAKSDVPLSQLSIEQIKADVEKLTRLDTEK